MLVAFATWVGAGVVATIGHELAHLAVAKAIGKDAFLNVREWQVHWEYRGTGNGPAIQDWFVAGAPMGLGVLAMAYWLVVFGIPAPHLVFGWLIFTCLGALTGDLQFDRVRTESQTA